jgi:hypothetical protein
LFAQIRQGAALLAARSRRLGAVLVHRRRTAMHPTTLIEMMVRHWSMTV